MKALWSLRANYKTMKLLKQEPLKSQKPSSNKRLHSLWTHPPPPQQTPHLQDLDCLSSAPSFMDFSSAASSFHLHDQVVKQSLFHLDSEDGSAEAVAQIRAKYGQTVFEVNYVIGGGEAARRTGAGRRSKPGCVARWIPMGGYQILYVCWLSITLHGEDPNLVWLNNLQGFASSSWWRWAWGFRFS